MGCHVGRVYCTHGRHLRDSVFEQLVFEGRLVPMFVGDLQGYSNSPKKGYWGGGEDQEYHRGPIQVGTTR